MKIKLKRLKIGDSIIYTSGKHFPLGETCRVTGIDLQGDEIHVKDDVGEVHIITQKYLKGHFKGCRKDYSGLVESLANCINKGYINKERVSQFIQQTCIRLEMDSFDTKRFTNCMYQKVRS